MATKKAEAKTQVKAARVQYSAEFRRQALLRAVNLNPAVTPSPTRVVF